MQFRDTGTDSFRIPVASEGILQQSRQLGVPVGHVGGPLALVAQSTYHIAKGQLEEKEENDKHLLVIML